MNPAGWTVKRFADVAEIVTGCTPPTSYSEYYGGSFPFVGPGDLGEITPITIAQKSLSESGAAKARILPIGSVLVCCIGATIGKVGISGCPLATNQQINALIFNEQVIDPRYAFHYCRSVSSVIRDAGTSTTLPILPKRRFQDLPIEFPSLPEQRRIAAILDKADAIRRMRRESVRVAEELLRSSFLEMFGDPVTNPKGWPRVALGEVASLSRGRFSPRPRNDPRFYGGHHPFIQTGDLRNCSGYLKAWKQTLNDDGLAVSKKFTKGTIAISIAANIGDTAILDFDSCFPDSVVGMELRDSVYTTEFFEYQFRLLQNSLTSQASETAQKNINLDILRPFKVTLAPSALQRKFALFYRKTYLLLDQYSAHLQAAEETFQSLLHRAFRGELTSSGSAPRQLSIFATESTHS